MAWDEDRRRTASTSKVNDDENTRRQHYPSGSGDPATSRIARGFQDPDTRKARDRLHRESFRRDRRLERLQLLTDRGDYRPTATETIEMGLYADARARAENDYPEDAA